LTIHLNLRKLVHYTPNESQPKFPYFTIFYNGATMKAFLGLSVSIALTALFSFVSAETIYRDC